MWNEYMFDNYFLKKLYNKIPPLENIIIRDISIREIFDSEDILRIEFEMPNFVDNVPQKWKKLNYDGIYIKIHFYDIMDIFIETKSNFNYSNIEIKKIEDIYQVEINGKLYLNFKTKMKGFIEYIKGMKK